MFGKSYTLFTLFGFKVRLDLTWLILAVLIAWTLAEGWFPYHHPGLAREVYWAMGLTTGIALLLSIVFHELSHSLVARRYGLSISGITLFIFGGVAQMEREPGSPKAELLMAAAGPAASFVLAGVAYGLLLAARQVGLPTPVTGVVLYVVYMNAVLAIFNLIPAFPLDGGRVLRAILWHFKHDLRAATRVSSNLGKGLAFLLIGLGALSALGGNLIGGLWYLLIGMFLHGAAQQSYRHVVMREELRGETVDEFMTRNVVTVSPRTTLDELMDAYVYKYHFKMFPVTRDDMVLGWVGAQDVQQVHREEWPQTRVEAILHPVSDDNSVDPEAPALTALSLMNRTGQSRLMVIRDQRLKGVISIKDLLRFIARRTDQEGLTGGED